MCFSSGFCLVLDKSKSSLQTLYERRYDSSGVLGPAAGKEGYSAMWLASRAREGILER